MKRKLGLAILLTHCVKIFQKPSKHSPLIRTVFFTSIVVEDRAVIDDGAVDTIANEDVYANAPIRIKKNYKISLKVDSLLPYIKDGRADKNANFTAEYQVRYEKINNLTHKGQPIINGV